MTARLTLLFGLLFATSTFVFGGAFDEVNAWRRGAGLPQIAEDPAMTAFAQKKAEYRAARGLKNGHQGPSVPAGWTEGCGEATASWGWLTCATECDFQYGGAGIAIGRDGERYMVFVGRGGSGRALINPNRYPIIKTAHLSSPIKMLANNRSTRPGNASGIVSRPEIMNRPSTAISASQNATRTSSSAVVEKSSRRPKVACPNCGRIH
ncbi:CAP domain-containing protein [Roseiconus lacunae]|uniref:CAP domain-containing protein n=1 Tax=Roseiconus lacunae TaxID=2605694 RepID=A0ABT7PFT7_9BACT|nr:CAP domain-containing protein [Roseiconus lacunae]MDM4015169.1 CAP domain-containing protein [Roseiconus lacunae]